MRPTYQLCSWPKLGTVQSQLVLQIFSLQITILMSSFVISPKSLSWCNTVLLYFCIWLLRSNTVFPTYYPQGTKYTEEPWQGFVSRALIGSFFTFCPTLETASNNHSLAPTISVMAIVLKLKCETLREYLQSGKFVNSENKMLCSSLFCCQYLQAFHFTCYDFPRLKREQIFKVNFAKKKYEIILVKSETFFLISRVF